MKHVTPKKTARFIELIAEGYTINHAAKSVGISRMAPYRLRDRNPRFAKKLADAMEAGADVMEDEMRRRGVEGTLKPVFHQGEICGHIREYSDTLLIFALKARRPEKYRDNYKVEHSGKIDVVDGSNWKQLTDSLAAQYGKPVEEVRRDLAARKPELASTLIQ